MKIVRPEELCECNERDVFLCVSFCYYYYYFFFFVNQIQFFRNCMIIDSRKINILIDITSI